MQSRRSRQGLLGRWAPIALYALIVLGWLGEGVSFGFRIATWLVVCDSQTANVRVAHAAHAP